MFFVGYVVQRTRSAPPIAPSVIGELEPPAHDRVADTRRRRMPRVHLGRSRPSHGAPARARAQRRHSSRRPRRPRRVLARQLHRFDRPPRSHPRRPALAGGRSLVSSHDRQPPHPQRHRHHGSDREAGSGGYECGRAFHLFCIVTTGPDTPTLLFFTSTRSGPARRMESLLTMLARKERGRLKVVTVDVDASPGAGGRLRDRRGHSNARPALRSSTHSVARIEGKAFGSTDRRNDPGSSSRDSSTNALPAGMG